MFINRFADLSTAYTSVYNPSLLILSLITATVAAWIAFGISRRLQGAGLPKRWLWNAWWLSGAIVMGLAVWAMHMIAMLALQLPVAFSFEPDMTALSLLPAVIGCAFMLRARNGDSLDPISQWAIAAALGAGIGLMHYIGMAGMRMSATMLYAPAWFGLSIVTAVVLSWLAVRLKWWAEKKSQHWKAGKMLLLGPSLAMGIAITAIHHVAMLGTYFFPNTAAPAARFQGIMEPEPLAWVIAVAVLMIALVLAATVHLSYRLELANLLEKSADFTRSLLDSANEGIVTTDQAGKIRTFNATAERMFGYKAANVIGRNVFFLLPETVQKMRDYFMTDDQLNLPRIINRSIELTASHADGNTFPVELTISPIQRTGQMEIVGVIRDITERKRAEKEARKHQEKMEFLLSASPIIIYTRSPTGTMPLTYVSPNVQELFGYLVKDLTAASTFWLDLVHEDDHELLLEGRKKLRAEGNHYLEYRIRYPNGQYRWISDRRVLLLNEDGKPDLIVGSWADIHNQKLAELRLAMNEERLRISLQSAKMATWDWHIETGEVIWSDDMRARLGLASDCESNFQTFINAVHPEDRQHVKAAFKQCLVKGTPFDEEYRVVWSDKSVHWIHSIGGLVNDADGSPEQMVGVLYDISEQKLPRLATGELRKTS